MEVGNYDDLISRILAEERQILPFLDAIFGFLWRRTDFFVIQSEGGKLGFPPGGAEKILLSVFQKWQNTSRVSKVKPVSTEPNIQEKNEDFPQKVAIEEIVSTSENINLKNDTPKGTQEIKQTTEKKKVVNSSEIYNGADRGSYRWSQSIGELDILIPVPEFVKKSKDVNVDVGDNTLIVKFKDKPDSADWKTIIDEHFCYRINKEESIWSLSSGQQISIHCEKGEERWWDGLLKSEPKLDTKQFDASRPMSDLSEEDQMKVQELMWNEERKKLGLKTSGQLKAENILKNAWNVEGSPFKGTEFDPSVLNFENINPMNSQGNE